MKQMYEKAVADDNLGPKMDNHDYNKPKFEEYEIAGFRGNLPCGYFNIPVLSRCLNNDDDACLEPCSNANSFGCNEEDGDSCLGFFGLYNKVVECDGGLTYPLYLYNNFALKKSDYLMAPKKGSSTLRKDSYDYNMTDVYSEMQDCRCKDYSGYPIQGTKKSVYVDGRDPISIATELGCGLCPANLIQTDKTVETYWICEKDYPITAHPFVFDSVYNDDEVFPLESRCTCPQGTVWPFAQMWCIPHGWCLPAENNVPPGCNMKNYFFIAIGHPPLDCDVTDVEDGMPEYHCTKLKNGKTGC